jgi:GT2 family glycosyltransferase
VKVAAVVVSHGHPAELAQALPALEPQVDELIVIANIPGSVPDGVEAVHNERPLGYAANLNRGFARTDAELLLAANPDAVPEPGAIDALRAFMQERPRCGVAGPRMVFPDGTWQPSRRRFPTVTGTIVRRTPLRRVLPQRRHFHLDERPPDEPVEADWMLGGFLLVRRAMLDEIGGFDEDLFAYGDDAELGLRARIAGWRCVYVPSAVVRHHRGATLGLQSRRRLELIERNRVLLAIKHFPLSLLWLNGFFFAARLLAGFWSGIRGQGEAARFPGIQGKFLIAAALVKGDFEAIAMIPSTLRKRRAMRPLRKLSSKQVRDLLFQYRIPLKALSDQAI